MKKHTPLPWPLVVFCMILGALWTATALAKGVSLFSGDRAVSSSQSWSENFPVGLQFVVVGVELLIGLWLLFGHRVMGLLAAIVLLGVFSVVLFLFPPAPDQSCGCGIVAEALPVEPVARNSVLAGLHAIALALVAQPRSETSPAPHIP